MSYTNYNHDYRRNKIREPAQLLAGYDIFHPTADQKYMLGCIFEMNDSRAFRYCKDSGTGITRARMACGLPPDSESEEELLDTNYPIAVGSVKFDIDLTAANGITDHSLIDGYMFINKTATVLGDFYIIKDNKWTTEDEVLNIEIADAGGIRQEIAQNVEIGVIRNRFRDCKVNPSSQDAAVVGVPIVDVAASYYFWAQYRGVCAVINETSTAGGVVIGEPCGKAGTPSTAGSQGIVATDGTDQTWGVVVSAGAADEISLIDLLIP